MKWLGSVGLWREERGGLDRSLVMDEFSMVFFVCKEGLGIKEASQGEFLWIFHGIFLYV